MAALNYAIVGTVLCTDIDQPCMIELLQNDLPTKAGCVHVSSFLYEFVATDLQGKYYVFVSYVAT